MKQLKIISRWLCIVVILSVGGACTNEYILEESIPPVTAGSKVDIPLYTNGEEFERPVTRATKTDEDNPQGSMPWVLVFRSGTGNEVFFEAVRAYMWNGELLVHLTRSTRESRLLIIANPPARFFDGTTNNLQMNQAMLTAKLAGKTYNQALMLLNTPMLNSPQGSVPYAGGHLPMSGEVRLNTIDAHTTIGTPESKVQLTRIVAKVSVENRTADFKLEGFTVIGAKRYGRLLSAAPAVAAGNKVDYLASTPADRVTGISNGQEPIYIYESSMGETSVIVKGKYKSVTSYYRLEFKSETLPRLSIKRNSWYQFTLKEVSTQGYPTLEDARVAPPSNIKVDLLVTDQNSMEIADNGQYYLGLSNSVFYAYSASEHSNLVAATITTNAPVGVKVRVEVASVQPARSLTVAAMSLVPNGTVKGADLKINLTKQFTRGTLKITVGNVMRTVAVERKPAMAGVESVVTFTPDYVSAHVESQGNGGDEWLTLSTDGVKYGQTEVTRPDRAGSIYLKVSNNQTIVARSGGVVYVTHKGSKGLMKLFITQIPIFR